MSVAPSMEYSNPRRKKRAGGEERMDPQTTTADKCRIRLGSFLLLFGLASALAQSAERARPEDVGLSSARLATIGGFTRAEMEKARMAGAVSLVARRGHIVLFEALG